MDPEQIIGQLIGGFFGGKSKRSRGGFGLSTLGLGRRGRGTHGGGLVNAGTLLTVGGLIGRARNDAADRCRGRRPWRCAR